MTDTATNGEALELFAERDMTLEAAMALADSPYPDRSAAREALRILRAALVVADRDARRWQSIAEMDGGAIYAVLGDYDGTDADEAGRLIDAASADFDRQFAARQTRTLL